MVYVLNLVVIFAAIKVLSDLLAAWIGEHRQQQFRSFVEHCRAKFECLSPDSLLTSPLPIAARIYERLLGPKPLSRQAFRRTFIFGSLFLAASLGFTGLLCHKPFAMDLTPWESFFTSVRFLKTLATEPNIQKIPGDILYFKQNVADLGSLDSWPFAVAFSIYFVVVVLISTSFLVSLSIAISRLFLQEMLVARTLFRMSLLFLSNTILLLLFGAITSFILFILLNVWTWP